MNERRFSEYAERILVILFFVVLLLLLLCAVNDPDVFWHLKTGEWIWQHKTLPDKDPFSFTVDAHLYEDSRRPYAILKGYWLSQLAIYGLYNIFGLYGIVLFRCLIYTGLIFLLYFWMRREGVNHIIALFFLIPPLLIVYDYGGERPNTLSYLIALIFFYILNEYVAAGKRGGLFLPVLMFLWPLLHGGFLVGEVIIGLYLIVKIYRLFKREISFKTDGYKIATLIISAAVPFVHENARNAPLLLLEAFGSSYAQAIAESTSPLVHFKMGDYSSFALIVLLICFIVVVIRKFSLEHFFSAIFTLAISLTAVRYTPFFVLLITPLVAPFWNERPTFNIYKKENKIFRYSMYAMVFLSIFIMGQSGFRHTIFLKGPISELYPDAAVAFIKAAKPRGNVFNYYGWGGYLIYRLYPEKKVFIDGRGLSFPVFDKYAAVIDGSLKISRDGTPTWRSVLDGYKIEMVLVPVYDKTDGRLIMLNKRLIDDPEWSLIFMGDKDNALFFLRNNIQNAEIIKRYSIRKELIYEKALNDMETEYKMGGNWRNDLQLGLVSTYLSRYDKATIYFEKAIEKNSKLKLTALYRGLMRIKGGKNPDFSSEEVNEINGY